MFKIGRGIDKNLIRIVEIKTEINAESWEIWELIENVKDYPKFIKFVKYAWLGGPFNNGSKWTDITTIIFFPILVRHEILEVMEKEKAVFKIRMPFNGSIIQTVNIKPIKIGVEFKIAVAINMGNKIADMIFGKFIEKRIYEMLNESKVNYSRLSKGVRGRILVSKARLR